MPCVQERSVVRSDVTQGGAYFHVGCDIRYFCLCRRNKSLPQPLEFAEVVTGGEVADLAHVVEAAEPCAIASRSNDKARATSSNRIHRTPIRTKMVLPVSAACRRAVSTLSIAYCLALQ